MGTIAVDAVIAAAPKIEHYAEEIASFAVPAIIKLEAHFPKGSGPAKALALLGGLASFVAGLSATGTKHTTPPTADQLQAMINTLVGAVKASGQMPVAGSAIGGVASAQATPETATSDGVLARKIASSALALVLSEIGDVK